MLQNIVAASAALLLSATPDAVEQMKSLGKCLRQASQLQDAEQIKEAKATCRETFPLRKSGEGLPTGTLFYKAPDLGICLEMGFDEGILRQSQPGFCGRNSRFHRSSSGQLLFTCISGGENAVFRADRRPEGIRITGNDFYPVLYTAMADCESKLTEVDREIYKKRLLEQQTLAARDAELEKQAGRGFHKGERNACCECLRAARVSKYSLVQCLGVSLDECGPSVRAGHASMIRVPTPSCRNQCSGSCPPPMPKVFFGLGGRRPSED